MEGQMGGRGGGAGGHSGVGHWAAGVPLSAVTGDSSFAPQHLLRVVLIVPPPTLPPVCLRVGSGRGQEWGGILGSPGPASRAPGAGTLDVSEFLSRAGLASVSPALSTESSTQQGRRRRAERVNDVTNLP